MLEFPAFALCEDGGALEFPSELNRRRSPSGLLLADDWSFLCADEESWTMLNVPRPGMLNWPSNSSGVETYED